MENIKEMRTEKTKEVRAENTEENTEITEVRTENNKEVRTKNSEGLKRGVKNEENCSQEAHGHRRCEAGGGTGGRVFEVCGEEILLHPGNFASRSRR